MEVGSRTVLITGGGSGIGRALAERLIAAGSRVIICGRREDKLREAERDLPGLRGRVCDLERESDRVSFVEWVTSEFPELDALFNNAGIQRRFDILTDPRWEPIRQELAINLDATIHLTALLIPHLAKQPRATIANVSSGLAFVPLVATPVYCATKAAVHSFTLALRQQLAKTSIDVIEIIPPAVNTDLGGSGLHASDTPLDEFADAAFAALRGGDREITYGFSAQSSQASRQQLDQIFGRMNRIG